MSVDNIFPIKTLKGLSVAMETRVLDRPGPNLSLTKLMLQVKFDCSWPAGCGDIYV